MDNAVKFKTGFSGYVRKDVDEYIDALVGDHDKQVIEMKKRLEEAMRVVDEKNTRCSELESKNIELRAQIDTLESQMGSNPQADAEIARLSDLLDRRTAEMETLKTMRDNAQQELDALKAQGGTDNMELRREYESVVRDKDSQIGELTDKIEAMRDKLENAGDASAVSEALSVREQEVASLKAQIEAMQGRLSEAGDASELAQTLRGKESELAQRKGEIAQKVVEIENLKSKIETLKQQLDANESSAELERLIAESRQTQEALEHAEKEKEAAIALRDARITDLQRQLEAAESAVEDARREQNSDEMQELYRKLDEVQRALGEATARIEEKNNEIAQLREQQVARRPGDTSGPDMTEILDKLAKQSNEIAALREDIKRSCEAAQQPAIPVAAEAAGRQLPFTDSASRPSITDDVLTAQAIERAERIVSKARTEAETIRDSLERNYESAYREVQTIGECIDNVNRLFNETARRIDGILNGLKRSDRGALHTTDNEHQ